MIALTAFYICMTMQLVDCEATRIPWQAEIQFRQGEICHLKVKRRVYVISGNWIRESEPLPETKWRYGWTLCSSLREGLP